MPLRSKAIIYGVVMLILVTGLSIGSYLSLSAASHEAELAREELRGKALGEAAQLLQLATVEAVRKAMERLASEDEQVVLRAAFGILDRADMQTSVKSGGSNALRELLEELRAAG